MHWRPSLALSARVTEKVIVHSGDLYFPKFALEDNQIPEGELQVNEFFKTSTGPKLRDCQFSFIGYVLNDILPNDS